MRCDDFVEQRCVLWCILSVIAFWYINWTYVYFCQNVPREDLFAGIPIDKGLIRAVQFLQSNMQMWRVKQLLRGRNHHNIPIPSGHYHRQHCHLWFHRQPPAPPGTLHSNTSYPYTLPPPTPNQEFSTISTIAIG